MKRAVLYARVSTQGQEDNTSLDDQIETCRRYAADNDILVMDELREVDSGVYIFSRPELRKALDLAEAGHIDTLLVDKLDRLGREDASTIIEYTLRQFDVGVIYVSSADTYDEGTLIIDMIDPLNHELIWRGISTQQVSKHTTPEESAAVVDETVEKILAQFPPEKG